MQIYFHVSSNKSCILMVKLTKHKSQEQSLTCGEKYKQNQ